MRREDIKSYKDACKCIGRKPRRYKDAHMNTYEQLTTIIAALNFIANGNKPWKHELHKKVKYYYIYGYNIVNVSTINELGLHCFTFVGISDSHISTALRLKEREDCEYLKNQFTHLLFLWFRE